MFKHSTRRGIALLLAAALLLTIAPLTATAADGDFVIENGVLLKYNGKGGDIVIPNGVTSIAEGAFTSLNDYPTTLNIPDSVVELDHKFSYCQGLTKVVIGNGVKTIKEGAFFACSKLSDVTIGDGVVTIEELAFGSGGADRYVPATIKFGNSVETIGKGAFTGFYGATMLVLPNSLKSIGDRAFEGWKAITELVIPDSVTSIGAEAFRSCRGLTTLKVGNGVKTIGAKAFMECGKLSDLTIGNNLISIGAEAFTPTDNLVSVTLPPSVTSVGDKAFYMNNVQRMALIVNPNLTISGASGSYAETYAKSQGNKFSAVAIAPAPVTPTETENAKPAESIHATSQPSVATGGAEALYTSAKVLIDNKDTAFEAYNIGGNNFFKLRDLAMVLSGSRKQFDVGYDGAKKAISLTSGKPYTTVGGELAPGDKTNKNATPTGATLYLNGKELALTAYNINGNNYFKLRDIGTALDFYVGYDDSAKTIFVDTSKPYSE